MKRNILKKLRYAVIFICLLPCLLFQSCVGAPIDTELLTSPFECEISWSKEGCELRAALSADGQNFSLRMLSPQCLSDIWVKGYGDAVSYGCGDTALGEPPAEYLRLCRLFCSEGGFEYLCQATINGRKAFCYTRGDVKWYFDSDTKKPIFVECNGLSVEILNIEKCNREDI